MNKKRGKNRSVLKFIIIYVLVILILLPMSKTLLKYP